MLPTLDGVVIILDRGRKDEKDDRNDDVLGMTSAVVVPKVAIIVVSMTNVMAFLAPVTVPLLCEEEEEEEEIDGIEGQA